MPYSVGAEIVKPAMKIGIVFGKGAGKSREAGGLSP